MTAKWGGEIYSFTTERGGVDKEKKKKSEYYAYLTFGSAFLAMRLHGDMGVQVVKSAVSLLTPVPAALVHALDLFVPATGSLVLLRTGNRDK